MRELTPEELAEVRQIFGAGLDTSRVRITEETQLPNWIGLIGALLKRQTPPAANAVTIANISYFPQKLTNSLADMGWLIHEVTHQWQYQHDGIRYLFEAIFAATYEYKDPGETPDIALKRHFQEGKRFQDFNREQQGDIVRDYFFAYKNSALAWDLSAWDPYLGEIRTPPR